MKLPKGYKVLKPVHPNAGLAAEYLSRLDDLIADMQASYSYWITAQYRKTPPVAMDADIKRVTAWRADKWKTRDRTGAITGTLDDRWFVYVDGEIVRDKRGTGRGFRSQAAAEEAGLRAAGANGVLTEPTSIDTPGKSPSRQLELELRPSPAIALEEKLGELNLQWTAEFDAMAPKLARWFAGSVGKRSQDRLKKVLRDGGMTVKFDMTPAMRDIVNATITENVGLIKSIGSQYHTEVQGMVMRSVTAGRDLGMLTKELEHRFGITRRRAATIALDQNNKATSNMVKVRQVENGLQAIWLHSAGGKEPRKTHVANSGKVYDPAVGWFDPDPKVRQRIWPGQLIKCRCVSRTVVKGFS